MTIVGVTSDVAAGRAVLHSGDADILVIAPANAQQQLAKGDQAVIGVEYDTVSPYRAFVARTAADQIVAAVNSQLITTGAKRVTDLAAEAGQFAPAEPLSDHRSPPHDAARGEQRRSERAEHRRLLRDHGPRR